jgi:hypothetical protein
MQKWCVVEEEDPVTGEPEYWIYQNGKRVAVLDKDFKTKSV